MCVLNPVKLIITNYPEDKTEYFEVENNPNDILDGTRKVSFSREIYIESDDFMINPVKKYFRLFPGNEVRLKSAYVIKCTDYKINNNILEIYAEYDPDSRGGNTLDGRKIKSTIHWVDSKTCVNATVNLYENLFLDENPESQENFIDNINKNSLKILENCKLEASLKNYKLGESYQFMRLGYFTPDLKNCTENNLVFNKSVSLKESFKIN